MRVRPTELGWKGLLLLAALECAFLATPYSNLFFLLLLFCFALGSLGCVWTLANLRGLQVERIDAPIAAAGSHREVTCHLRARRPRCAVRVELRLEGGIDGGLVAVGQADRVAGELAVAGTLPPRRRGVARVSGVRLSSRFPLGLFVAHADLAVAAELVTHPAPADAAAVARATGSGDSTPHHGTRAGAVQELREFRSGDSVGDVHWKATARRGQPVVKARDRQGDPALSFVLDRRCSEAALEQALAVVTAAVLQARTRGAAVAVLSQDASFPATGERGAEAALLRWLALAAVLPADAAPPPRADGAVRLPPARLAEVPA